MTEGIASLGKGDFEERIDLGRDDEWSALQDAFNFMADEVSRAYGAVQERESLYRHLIENQSDLLINLDRDGRILFANANYCDFVDQREDDLLGTAFIAAAELPTVKAALHAPPFMYAEERQSISRKGMRWVSWSHRATLDKSGRIAEIVAVGRDVTRRKEAEARIHVAMEQAEIANRAKTEFLTNMSHELRTPLNTIIGYSDVIKGEIFGPVGNKQYVEYAGNIVSSGEHLLELINDILDISAIEAGKIELENDEITVDKLLEVPLRLIKPHAELAQVSVKTQIPGDLPKIRVDQRRIKQVLINLLSNAVKFTPQGGAITIFAETAADGGMTLIVIDTGVGMTEAELRTAVTQFGQVDSGLNRKHEGTGLGLPLAKGLIDLHGGRFEIESRRGHGTTVRVHLPPERVVTTDWATTTARDAPR